MDRYGLVAALVVSVVLDVAGVVAIVKVDIGSELSNRCRFPA